MNELQSVTLTIPTLLPDGSIEQIPLVIDKNLVIIGANGSGKTKLCAHIDRTQPFVMRVSANKLLTISEAINLTSTQLAKNQLLLGANTTQVAFDIDTLANVRSAKWSYYEDNHVLNDYDNLLVYLFSENATVSNRFRERALSGESFSEVPMSKLDLVKNMFNTLLPHRSLEVLDNQLKIVTTDLNQQVKYNPSSMSDGEKVIFYLIGKCISAEPGSFIVIDEPEIYLHKAVQYKLWDEVEKSRPDCYFIYATHDLDFAASRKSTKKIWLKKYSHSVGLWEWQEIPDSDLPESLLFELLGSRRPILFCEGSKNGPDDILYSFLFPDHLVVPVGSCTQVVSTYKSFLELEEFHRMKPKAIIDRDRHSVKSINNYRKDGILVLQLSEIENMYTAPPFLIRLADMYKISASEIIPKTQNYLVGELRGNIERVVSARTAYQIEVELRKFNNRCQGIVSLEREMKQLTNSIDITSMYLENEKLIRQIIESRDILRILSVFDNKGMIPDIAKMFSINKDTFVRNCEYFMRTDSDRLRKELLGLLE